MGGEVEDDREALLAGREVAAEEGTTFAGGGKPAYCRIVHGRFAYMVARTPRGKGSSHGTAERAASGTSGAK
jgi:hypothetical protein